MTWGEDKGILWNFYGPVMACETLSGIRVNVCIVAKALVHVVDVLTEYNNAM